MNAKEIQVSNKEHKLQEKKLVETIQQLKATQQQLRANNQQLQATEQQLRALNQQLEASNKELINSEYKLKTAESIANMGFLEWNFKSGNIIVSDSLRTLFGFTKDEPITSELLYTKVYPDDISLVQRNLERTLEEKKYHPVDYRINKQHGEIRWISTKAEVIYDQNGEIVSLLAVYIDITNRKRMEESLKQSEDRLSKTLMAANDGMWDWNLKTNEVYFDPRYYAMAGYQVDEFPHRLEEFQKRIHPDDVDYVMGQAGKHLAGETERFTVEFRFKKKNNDWLWILGRGIIVERESSGKPLRFIGTHTDITQRKLTEIELNKLSTAVAQSPLIIAITDKKGVLQYVNARFTEITGYTTDEVIGKNPRILQSGEHSLQMYKELWKTVASGEIWQGELCNKKKNGQLYWESASIAPVFDSRNKITNYMKISEDITEKKRALVELQKIEKLKSIGTLAGGIAHDFNNMLTGMYGYVTLAQKKLDSNHPAYQYLSEAEKSMDRATKLTNQLLTFSKGGEPVKKVTDLAGLLEETVRFDLSGSSIKPVFTFDQNLSHAEIDSGQIQQVFSNLTINAKQASSSGGCIYISGSNYAVREQEHPSLKPGNYVKIVFRDEGSGIAPENLTRIFDPFFTTKENGSGLGLATTYSIIKKHQGYVQVHSVEGAGTEFTIFLPASKNKNPLNSKVSGNHRIENRPSIKILIMDDEKIIREMAIEMLDSLGIIAESASNGEETLRIYREARGGKAPFDIIILDLTIKGGMGGKETVKEILKINPNEKVIVSSGYTRSVELNNFASLGFIAKIDKPYTLQKLEEVIFKVLR